jgi:hypothetical protein
MVLKRVMLIVSVQRRKRRGILKDSDVNQLRLVSIKWMLNIYDPTLKRALQMRLENWTSLLLNFWEIYEVFRLNIFTNNIDL